ncbi:transcription factor FER-LIKE IRON DEFICIENCY-INDUCED TRANSCRIPTION FACTOR-like protein [Cinnamomum micranthum f. kanehirae]|uniref:Transcription factor FER-LIKE IRON DEFICIENCY-INDUCED TRANSCRIPTION FACTOR-like protein n=1 Tax=Cinnamomum micranthum f. kanehirae TaxID=337451 RepID=A0A3S3NM73_9MAGN|nr:transcription factor FER-LIKE IRON DEFICIENCY-INDUCED TRANSCRIPTION FACTOR-like protein [Cinnamomum micranthum f. kanehirae]
MEFENLNFWSPESGDSDGVFRQIPDCPSAIFSPIQCDYGSYLEYMEMELLQGGAREPMMMMMEEEEEDKSGGGNEEEEPEEDDNGRGEGGVVLDGGATDDGILGNGGCKNLLSERNRRKRLNQQLLALRSLVPCISKMDKRSILMDAATYLQNLHREIEEVKREIATQETSDTSTTSSESNLPSPEETIQCNESSPPQHQILNIDIEEMDERTFAVKVVFQEGSRGSVSGSVHD